MGDNSIFTAHVWGNNPIWRLHIIFRWVDSQPPSKVLSRYQLLHSTPLNIHPIQKENCLNRTYLLFWGFNMWNFPGVYRFFFDGPPLLDQQKDSIFLKSPKKITNRRHGDRYVLWHNPWQVWAQKPLIGSSSQSGLGVERYHEWRSRKKDVFIYRRKILIINISMIGVAVLFIKFLSLFFELIVKIALFFEDQIVNG